MVVNKDPLNAAQTTFTLNGFTPTQVTSYTLSQSSPTSIVAGASQAWSSTMTFAPYTATLLVVTGSTPNLPAAEWDLNPDTIMVASGGTITLHPKFVAPVAGTVALGPATSDPGITVSVSQAQVTAGLTGAVTATASTGGTPATPGCYPFSVPATDTTGAAPPQSGRIVGRNPAP